MTKSVKVSLGIVIAYVAIGVLYNVATCATWNMQLGQDGSPPDIPCAGIPWTPMMVAGWPLFVVSDLLVFSDNQVISPIKNFLVGAFTILVASAIIYFLNRYFRKSKNSKNTRV